jgi:hypothetical protein
MKPYPLVALNHLTVPTAMALFPPASRPAALTADRIEQPWAGPS